MVDMLYHYYDESTGPFRNLSDVEQEEAGRILQNLRTQDKWFAGKRSMDYLEIRNQLEKRARDLFILKGGRPTRTCPHYMTLGECPWLLDWYPKGRELRIPLTKFDPTSVSFTYGDLFPTMRYQDGKPYRAQVYMLDEIYGLIQQYGMPQEWNRDGLKGPERYIEVQIWDDESLMKHLK